MRRVHARRHDNRGCCWGPIYVRCRRPVIRSVDQYETFERMHYVGFHYEFEHDPANPDEECQAVGCPSASLAAGRSRVIETAAELALEAAQGAPWTNDSVPRYLEACSGWLADSDGYYTNQRRVPPGNGWEVVTDALRAATMYE